MMTPSLFFRSACLGALLLGSLLLTLPAEAQQGRRVTRTPQELLEAFPRSFTPEMANSPVSTDLVHISLYPEDYPAADLEVLLQGIERLALTAESPDVRWSAAFYLSLVGSGSAALAVAPIFRRLLRIYRRTNDPRARRAVTEGMANVADRPQALAFLERVATEDPPPFPGAAPIAVTALIVIGEEARPVLRRLHESGAVRDHRARRRLEGLAENDFRRPR